MVFKTEHLNKIHLILPHLGVKQLFKFYIINWGLFKKSSYATFVSETKLDLFCSYYCFFFYFFFIL